MKLWGEAQRQWVVGKNVGPLSPNYVARRTSEVVIVMGLV